jgi:hypothetical protein
MHPSQKLGPNTGDKSALVDGRHHNGRCNGRILCARVSPALVLYEGKRIVTRVQ